MTDHERLMEEYEDALFALLMEGVAEAEGEKALRLNEELKKDPNAEVPEAIRKRCEKTIRAAFAKKRHRTVRRTVSRWLTKAAVVAVLSGLLFTAAFALSEDVRVATLNILIEVMDNRTIITFEGDSSEHAENTSKIIPGLEYHYNIALEWLPEGFELDSGNFEENGTGDYVSYLSSQDGLIEVGVTPYSAGLTKSVNTEDCTEQDVMVNDHLATLYITNEDMLEKRYHQYGMTNIWSQMMIYWVDEELQVIVQVDATNVTEDEIIRLAEGIHWNGGI